MNRAKACHISEAELCDGRKSRFKITIRRTSQIQNSIVSLFKISLSHDKAESFIFIDNIYLQKVLFQSLVILRRFYNWRKVLGMFSRRDKKGIISYKQLQILKFYFTQSLLKIKLTIFDNVVIDKLKLDVLFTLSLNGHDVFSIFSKIIPSWWISSNNINFIHAISGYLCNTHADSLGSFPNHLSEMANCSITSVISKVVPCNFIIPDRKQVDRIHQSIFTYYINPANIKIR